MAGLRWMVVVLAFSLSAGNSEAVDQNRITTIVEAIKRYFIKNIQFSLAVNIPSAEEDLEKAFEKDDPATVKAEISNGGVYKGTNVVGATFKKGPGGTYTDHAEERVLDNIKPLADKSKGNILILYSYLSPCGAKCADPLHPSSIIPKINKIIGKSQWGGRAFVFSKVFDKVGNVPIPLKDIKKSLENLGKSKIGENNIFRCYSPKNQKFTCVKCFSNGFISDQCVKN